MEYNARVAQDAQDEVKDMVSKFPEYAKKILDLVNDYEGHWHKYESRRSDLEGLLLNLPPNTLTNGKFLYYNSEVLWCIMVITL